MKAAVLREVNQPLQIEDIQHGDPSPREVLVRTVAAGVCHSDLHFQNGSYPYPLPAILGHESAGVVEAVGDMVTYVKPGDHVITCLSAFCGHCEFCLTGHMSLCQEPELQRPMDAPPRLAKGDENIWQFLNLSSFAEYMLVHEHAIAKVREDMPLDRAALIGCGVTTGVGAVIHTAAVEPGTTVAVIGCGGVGLSAVNGAAIAGAARIIAVDTVESKLELARKFGATDVVNAGETDAVAAVRELTGGGAHYSFEAIGLKATAEQAFKMVGRGGTATIVGMIPMGTNIEIHGPEFLQERTLQGSNMGSNRFRVDMPRFVDFYLQGKLHLDDMISRRIKLEDVNEALAALETGEVARSVIMFE
ncbi:MAG: Zn-dependent alcohol dehydrogenase [Pseudomonadales bacterium]|jgi:S-(hydroxymethyl)glutathione dehydrogenase/alcohol dehydrogenase|nr:Zn-dependent alcohol dehydrogenase [Pseudomonadales bacterium]MDP6470202.1 Zn-dependent alcohol dehydrogenase [Pseudomonadales bacterium]MDP6827108.1 Zn-dependent alcohol dehydrogenase [Pseudomonadales bacterium]MDP6971546.1 Zn-dependent alcohol dehydrogenase [Pseudomonadales bacterium]|tara:strand:+ start:1834 stop:2916 length:1083 start_codon:yes stop_codon:yes gene_type:complete